MEKNYDAIIVGSGVAGLFAAYHLPKNMNVLLITKAAPLDSNSYLAQGGISTLRDDDDFESYVEDTLKAGHYENDLEAVDQMIRDSREVVEVLDQIGVPFEKQDGSYCYTREGAHSKARILHYQDITGQAIMTKLFEQVQQMPHIEISPYTTMIDWLVHDEKIYGLRVVKNDEVLDIKSQRVILATGGIGGVFENSTNFSHITGDSIALALKYGVQLKDMNYIQIHPTALYSTVPGRRFLISEAVRGEGGILLNQKGERFVNELLPRDVVSLAIYEEMAKQHKPYVYLSFEPIGEKRIREHFPNIAKRCQTEGFDLFEGPIPVTPAQHYFMGGIKTDLKGKTSLEGLYAVGEVACNGVHGANRLASNSLLESLVFAKQAAKEVVALQVEDVALEWNSYNDQDFSREKWEKECKQLILEEIKRKDEKFYEQWCHSINQCG